MSIHWRRIALAAGPAMLLYGARRYFDNWGTTKEECRTGLPGDELVRSPVLRTTKGIWIERSATAVWPWLVQMGQGRGGLYSYEFLENSIGLRHRNANRIRPEWQSLSRRHRVRLAPRGWLGLHDGIAMAVAEVVEERAIVLHVAPPSLPWEIVFSFHLIPHGEDRCRLLARTRLGLRHPGEVVLAEMASPVTALMTRAMLRGIRRRAHNAPNQTPLQPTSARLNDLDDVNNCRSNSPQDYTASVSIENPGGSGV